MDGLGKTRAFQARPLLPPNGPIIRHVLRRQSRAVIFRGVSSSVFEGKGNRKLRGYSYLFMLTLLF